MDVARVHPDPHPVHESLCEIIMGGKLIAVQPVLGLVVDALGAQTTRSVSSPLESGILCNVRYTKPPFLL